MDIDLPEAVAEVRAAFDRYEKALIINDLDVLNSIFRDAPQTIRYGIGENLYGYDQIKAFRGAGRYDDQLIRTDEGWKISRREQTVLWVDGNSAVLSF